MEKEDYLKESLSLINKSDFESAEVLLKEGLSCDRDNEKLLNLLGWVLYQTGRYEEMIEIYKKLVKSNPQQSFSLFYNLGRAYFQLKDYRSAAEAFRKTIEITPNHKNAIFYLSASYEKLGDLKSSKKYLAKLVSQGQLDDKIKDVSIQSGLIERSVGDFNDYFSNNIDISQSPYKKASFFGTWSIATDHVVVWSGSFETENYIEHTVFKGDGRILFAGEPMIINLAEHDIIFVNGSYLIGIDNLFEGVFNKSNFLKIKGPRKVIIQQKAAYIEDISEQDFIRRDKVIAIIGDVKIKSFSENLFLVQKGSGKVILV